MSDVPASETGEPAGAELLRAWIVGEELHCSLQPAAFDAATWGVVLADVARHIAEGLREVEGQDPAVALEGIRTAFVAELRPGSAEAGA